MIDKLVTSGLCGASLISAFLLFNGFNPAHNQTWVIGAGLIAATSTLTAELSSKKKHAPNLKDLLKRNLKQHPPDSAIWQSSFYLLDAIAESENQENSQLPTK